MNAPLRVLVIGPAPAGPDSRGGIATVMAAMANHPDQRFEITIVPTFLDVSRPRKLTVGMRGMLRSALLVLGGHVDVLHVHLSHGGSVVRKALPLLAAQWTGTPSVLHCHSFDFGGWFDRLPTSAQRIVRRALPADRWLVLGQQHVGEYANRLRLGSDQIQVLHNAIRVPELPVDQACDDRVHAVMLGRMGARKGSYDLVAAVGQLEPEIRRRLRVTLAGDGEVDAVAAAVSAARADDTIQVAGWLDPRQRDDLLADAHIFLLPSRDEGLPMAVLEAMAAGLAPITTTAGSIGEVISDRVHGLLVDAGSPEQIAAALSELVADETLRTRLGSAARERAAGFSVSRWYEQLGQLWAELAAAPVTPPLTAPLRQTG